MCQGSFATVYLSDTRSSWCPIGVIVDQDFNSVVLPGASSSGMALHRCNLNYPTLMTIIWATAFCICLARAWPGPEWFTGAMACGWVRVNYEMSVSPDLGPYQGCSTPILSAVSQNPIVFSRSSPSSNTDLISISDNTRNGISILRDD